MAFFDIRNSDYDVDKIEVEILESLKKKGIPIEQEREFLDKYDLKTAKREILSKPINIFKIILFKMPPWMIQLVKRIPFYRSIRKIF